MIIFSPLWGDKHKDWSARGLETSLNWPLNKAALKDVGWVRPKNAHEVMPVLRDCIASGRPLLMAPPDTIFSDGTIPTLLNMGQDRGACISFAHVRVLPGFLDDLDKDRMVSRAWEYLHPNWVEAEACLPQSGSFYSGLSWRFLSDKLIGVQHRLPTVFYANFTPSDFGAFSTGPLNAWDTYWPSSLFEQGRLRYVGSSDAAFAVELTERTTHGQSLMQADLQEPDKYHMTEPHNFVNRCMVSIFRKES